MEDNSRPLLKIAITPEEADPAVEAADITALLNRGWTAVHLRHPRALLRDMRRLIELIPQRYHRQLRLHGHFDLAADFNLGGLHLNGRCPEAPHWYGGALSRTCHSVDEVIEADGYDYVTLSPIFDSVSKPGYLAAFTDAELRRLDGLDTPAVIALGGITAERIDSLKRYNFAGYAMLGSIPWGHVAATDFK